jgi:hypothetical protein
LQCGGPNTEAQDLGPCIYGCCSQDSHCCKDKGCTGCPNSKWQKPIGSTSTQSNTNSPTAKASTTSQPKNSSSIPTNASPSPTTQPSSPSDVGSEFHV